MCLCYRPGNTRRILLQFFRRNSTISSHKSCLILDYIGAFQIVRMLGLKRMLRVNYVGKMRKFLYKRDGMF